jgi:glycosyltransferase involved in cell wall biosynthesis
MKPRRLNILFLTPWYPTKEHIYAGVFVREYAKAMQKYNNVVVLHVGIADQSIPRWWGTQRENDEDLTDGIPSYRAVYRCARMRGCSWPRYWVSVIRSVAALSKEYGPFDLVHAHVFSTGSAALLIGRWYGIPVVISEHYTGFARGSFSRSQIRQAQRVFRGADAVLPVSHALQRAIEQYGIKASFRVVPNTVNTDLFSFKRFSPAPDGTVRLLTVTSFVAHKGLAALLRALSQVSWRDRPWHLDVVGGGPDAVQHRNMADELGLAAHVTFHGSMLKSEVARMMRGADLFVLPSLVETFSVATAEALASGVPVLVTRCGGPEEFVEESCGMVVPPGDATALAEGLMGMLDRLKSYDRKEIARTARERFGYEAVATVLDEVYTQMIGSAEPHVKANTSSKSQLQS